MKLTSPKVSVTLPLSVLSLLEMTPLETWKKPDRTMRPLGVTCVGTVTLMSYTASNWLLPDDDGLVALMQPTIRPTAPIAAVRKEDDGDGILHLEAGVEPGTSRPPQRQEACPPRPSPSSRLGVGAALLDDFGVVHGGIEARAELLGVPPAGAAGGQEPHPLLQGE